MSYVRWSDLAVFRLPRLVFFLHRLDVVLLGLGFFLHWPDVFLLLGLSFFLYCFDVFHPG